MFLPATDGNDLLQIAEALCTRAGMAVPLYSLQERAVRSFCERRFEQASALFAEVLERRETSDVWCDRATARTICEDPSGAERGFRRALDLNAGNDLAALKLGVLLAGLERNADAVHYLEQCGNRRQEPERTEVLQLLATRQSMHAAAVTS